MAWNEPGGNNRDPWGGGGRDQGPPDLDEVIRKLSGKFGGLFGGKGGGGGGGGPRRAGGAGIGVIVAIVVVGWLLSGIYIVEEGKRGVVLRFGAYVDTTMPGPHWRIPWPFERVEIVDAERRRFAELGYRSGGGQSVVRSVPREALMLTQDENIVDVRIAVQYQVSDPQAYLFNVLDPDLTLTQVVESATREAIGKSTMDFVLTEGRAEIVAQIQTISQNILDLYGVGLRVSNVNLQDAQPPEEVQDAFADAIKAREDEQRLINEAEAYRNEVLPTARGQAARRLQEAEGYRAQVVAQAEGEASRFEQLLTEYQKAPEVTRERLYLETMQEVLSNTSKVMVDVPGGNNLFYLPLDQIIRRSGNDQAPEGPTGSRFSPERMSQGSDDDSDMTRFRDTSRSREMR
ncbi:MAG: FtsH protease activity modulator HflK [Candidatus Competibacteraceae bacterium]|nr:FtsH protease activity modulator HflK [Candidatus Competibacteraceae bacterium]